jgi:hypothetical protein
VEKYASILNEESVQTTLWTQMPISNHFGRNVPIFADKLHDVIVLLARIIKIIRTY